MTPDQSITSPCERSSAFVASEEEVSWFARHETLHTQRERLIIWEQSRPDFVEIPVFSEALERHGHLHLSDACREQLLSMSPATTDHLLCASRIQRRHGLSVVGYDRFVGVQVYRQLGELYRGCHNEKEGYPLWRSLSRSLNTF